VGDSIIKIGRKGTEATTEASRTRHQTLVVFRQQLPFLIQEPGASYTLSVVAWILFDTDTALQLKMNFIVKFGLFGYYLRVDMINHSQALMDY
jgi:hypothetical protein